MTSQVQDCALLDVAIDAFGLDQSISFVRFAGRVAFDGCAPDKHGCSMTEYDEEYNLIKYDYGTTIGPRKSISLYLNNIY